MFVGVFLGVLATLRLDVLSYNMPCCSTACSALVTLASFSASSNSPASVGCLRYSAEVRSILAKDVVERREKFCSATIKEHKLRLIRYNFALKTAVIRTPMSTLSAVFGHVVIIIIANDIPA